MICAPAENSRPEPLELAAFADGVRLAFELPPTTGGGKKSEGLALSEIVGSAFFRAPVVVIMGPFMLFKLRLYIQHRSRFEKGDAHAFLSEYLNGCTTAGSGADNDDIEGVKIAGILEHETFPSVYRAVRVSCHAR